MTLLEFANYLSQNYSASDDVNVGELLEAIYRVEGRPLVLPLSVRAKSEASRPLHQCKTLEDIQTVPDLQYPLADGRLGYDVGFDSKIDAQRIIVIVRYDGDAIGPHQAGFVSVPSYLRCSVGNG